MTTRLDSIVLDAGDPEAAARWWGAALAWPVEVVAPGELVVAVPGGPRWGDGGQPALVFEPVAEPKTVKNRVHLDLASGSAEEQGAIVARLVDLGARRVDIGQREVPWVVLADPDGNEFCVLDPRPEEPLGAPIGAVVLDCADPARLAGFWSAASGWPVVGQGDGWARLAGPAGAPPLELLGVPDPKSVKNRLHLDVSPYPGEDQAAVVDRLLALGARRVDIGQGAVSWVVLADPEGNELCVLTPR